jgi:predicted kinase
LRLKAYNPIDIALSDFGVDMKGRLIVLYGRNGLEIEAWFKRAGLLPDDQQLQRDPTAVAHAELARLEPTVLVATVGLPYSGKSTWARTQGYPIVCPDEIRTALHGHRFIHEAEPFVWAIATVMVRSLFGSGHRFVILDACNTTTKRREAWYSASNEWALRFKSFDADAATCLARAESAGDSEIQPIIENMARRFEPLDGDELLRMFV